MPGIISYSRVALAAAGLLLYANAGAVELGSAAPLSFVAQPLKADIELVAITAAEMSVLQVRQATLDVYAEASIARNPALSSFAASVLYKNSSPFIRVSSEQPIQDDHVHIFLEMVVGDKKIVRSATIWLTKAPVAAIALSRPEPLAVTPEHVTASAPPHSAPGPVLAAAPPLSAIPAVSVARRPIRRAPSEVAAARASAITCTPASPPEPDLKEIGARGLLTEKLVQIESRVKVLQESVPAQGKTAPSTATTPTKAPSGVMAPVPKQQHSSFTSGTVALLVAVVLLLTFFAWRSKTALRAMVDRLMVKVRGRAKSVAPAEPMLEAVPPLPEAEQASGEGG